MSSGAKKRRGIRAKRVAIMASPPKLTPEVCDKVVAAKGPTFRTTSQGHVCVQTGARVNRGQCQNYRVLVTNGTSAMIAYHESIPKVGKGRKAVVERYRTPAPPAMKELEWDGSIGYHDCPHCHHSVRIYNAGVMTCHYCVRNFKVVEKQAIAIRIKYYDSISHYSCPHCYELTCIRYSGLTSCGVCGKPINAEWSL